jgi:hypothetical protein
MHRIASAFKSTKTFVSAQGYLFRGADLRGKIREYAANAVLSGVARDLT